MSISSCSSALDLLPHGSEFRFIDQVMELVPGVSGNGEYLLRGNEAFLKGHFPGHPMFPGVLLLEAGAQMAGVVAQSDPDRKPMPGLKLTALRSVKILGTITPGETLKVEARIIGRLANLVQATVKICSGPRLLMEGEIVLSGENEPSHGPIN